MISMIWREHDFSSGGGKGDIAGRERTNLYAKFCSVIVPTNLSHYWEYLYFFQKKNFRRKNVLYDIVSVSPSNLFSFLDFSSSCIKSRNQISLSQHFVGHAWLKSWSTGVSRYSGKGKILANQGTQD